MAVESIISEIEKLSVLELAELVKALEEKFGVTAQAAVVALPRWALKKPKLWLMGPLIPSEKA